MKKNIKTIATVIVAVLISMSIAACNSSKPVQNESEQPGESSPAPVEKSSQSLSVSVPPAVPEEKRDIKLGIVAPLTGGSAQMGNMYLKGILLAVDEINEKGGINGHKIVTVIEDDKGVPIDSVTATRKLINDDKVDLFFGGLNSSNALANKPIAEEEKVPMFTGGTVTAIVTLDGWVFRCAVSNELQAGLWGRYAVEGLGGKTIAFIHEEDSYGTELYEFASEAMKELGVEPVIVETYKRDDSDYSAQLLKIRALNPDIVMIGGIGVESARIARQARQLFTYDVKLTGSDLWGNPETLSLAGDAAEGVVYFAAYFSESSESPVIREVWGNFLAKHGEPPTEHVARGYSGMMVIEEALSKMDLSNGVNPDEFRNQALATKALETPLGTSWYDASTGELFHQIAMYQYQNGKAVFLTTVKGEN